MTFRTSAQAIAFYDGLETAKGPSLGTNFTLRLVEPEHLHKTRSDEMQLPVYSTCALQ